jgi:hypothetical protein
MSLKTDIYIVKTHKEKINIVNKKRVRQPVTPSKGRVVGYFPSVKSNEPIAWESQMELTACRIFEYCPTVQNYREQPETVYYTLNGVGRKYIPDFELILINDERVYIEIKPKRVLNKNEEKDRFVAISNHLNEKGITFAVMTEDELNNGYIQDNIKLIHPYAAQDVNVDIEKYFKELWSKNDMTVGDFIQLGLSLKTIYSSITQGFLKIDLNKKISRQSSVLINKETDHENSIFSCRFAPDFK